MRPIAQYQHIYRITLVALILALSSGMSHALTIGEPLLQSRMNEPLKVQLPILTMTEEERAELNISNASLSTYQAMRLPYPKTLKKMRIEIKEHNGQYYVELSTPNHIREPLIDLVLSIDYGKGRLIRNFTLMLDPGDM